MENQFPPSKSSFNNPDLPFYDDFKATFLKVAFFYFFKDSVKPNLRGSKAE
jgi:hypothetical protein